MTTRGGFEEFYVRCSASVFRRARQLLGDDDDAKDATQEVFMRALRVDRDELASPSAWSHTVVTNLCLKKLRDKRRRRELLALWQPEHVHEDGSDQRLVVQRIFDSLPPELRDIAIRHYVDELPHHEIAALIGVSRRTIGNRLAALDLLVAEFLA